MKPGPIIAMVLVVLLGLWLVWLGPGPVDGVTLREGATTVQVRVGQSKGIVEIVRSGGSSPEQATFRLLMPGGHASDILTHDDLVALLGESVVEGLAGEGAGGLFRLFNITSWTSMIWIGIGLGGQIIFSSRFLIQWIISERRQESVIPEIFWWISLGGAVCLFTYFVWRRDVVGVLGQSTGVVIYVRNLRLIHKRRNRVLRHAQRDKAARQDRESS